MHKKDYIMLANAIREYNHVDAGHFGGTPFTPDQLNSLCMCLSQDNDRFIADRWIDYINGKCGPSGGKVWG